MVYIGLEVIRYKHYRRATEIWKHIGMNLDPVLYIQPQATFRVGMHAERQNSHKKVDRNSFIGIPANDIQLVSGLVNLDSFTGLSGNVHGSALLLGKLLKMEEELRVHEGLFTQLTALLAVLHPDEFEGHTVAGQFFGYLFEVRYPAKSNLLLLLWEQ